MPEFTSDWFSHNIPAWSGFFGSIGWDRDAPKTIIEIGSYEGRASLWMLESLLGNEQSRLHCVDVFADQDQPNSYWHRFKANVLNSAHGAKVEAHATTSFAFLNRLVAEGGKADFIYIDGSHRAADVLEDLVLSFPRPEAGRAYHLR
jgi:predicted O-methyltransferase YrrM